MAILDTALDPRAPSFLDNRSTALAALSLLEAAHAEALEGGGEREVTRHHARGKLLPRERIELLVDRDTALLELSATAGLSKGQTAGAGVVTAIGVVERIECLIVGNDPTVRESGLSEPGNQKVQRAVELAQRYQLPLIFLWESVPRARELVVRSDAPVLAAVFGPFVSPVALADYCVAVRGHGEVTAADAVADDERDALRIVRQVLRHVARGSPSPLAKASAPRHEMDDLLAVDRTDLREVLARILDGSELEEIRSHRGTGVLGGFGSVHGRKLAILGNTTAELDAESVNKGLELIRLATMADVPVLVLANSCAPSADLARALVRKRLATVLLDADPPEWALVNRGFTFAWASSSDDPFDGVIDPRDTRTVLGIALSVMGGPV